jgi:transposase InsO family protein
MPWKELCTLELRTEMITDWMTREYSITELSERYGVSRKTVYKWIERYESLGFEGLKELCRAPHWCANATPEAVTEAILAMKKRKMNWGPKKILAVLRGHQPDTSWPADSTGHDILKRHGLVRPRKYRRHVPPYTEPFLGCAAPNQVWSADYKGQFRLGDARLCYPLTISDNNSRYLLGCWGLSRPTFEQTRPYFEWVFRHNGLPDAIRTDNGAPFASVGLGGLSRLSVWFIQLGIRPERIEPGCPEQNGRHERMHRTLKAETANPPRRNMEQQQKAFNRFQFEYNHERPHEALGQQPPASAYRPSLRPFPTRPPKVEYNSGSAVRHVHTNGCIKWKGNLLFLSETLIGQSVALTAVDTDLWAIAYSFHPIGLLNERKMRIQPY